MMNILSILSFLNPIRIYQFVKNIPWLWKLLLNYGTVKKVLEDAWAVVLSAKQNGGLPTCEDTKKMIDVAREIFEKELIDIPDFDEIKFSQELREIENSLVCSIKDARQKEGLPL